MSSWSLIVRITTIYLTNPLLLMTIAFGVSWVILTKMRKLAEYKFFTQTIFLFVSFPIWVMRIPYSNIDIISYAGFAFFLTLSIITDANTKSLRVFGVFSVLSLVTGSIIAATLYPILNQLNPQSPMTLLLFNAEVPTLYYYIIPTSVLSFLLGFSNIYCWDRLAQEIRPRKLPVMSFAKTIFVYFQFIPLCLLPIFLAQIFARTERLGWLANLLSFLCITYILLNSYSFCLAFLGDKILRAKYLWISSIFTLVSVASTLYIAFQYIVWKVDYGSWALAFLLAPLISYVSGITAKRYGDDFS